jgi:hypothetical protein
VPSSLQFHDYQFSFPTAAGKWRWTTRLDVSQSAPAYWIRDIISPFGLLRDSIPLDGSVVQAMSDSIAQLKANFAPVILLGPPTSLTFLVDEGRGFSDPQFVILTNSGVFGSILNNALTGSVSYMRITPANVGGLASNQAGQFKVEVDSTTLLAASSPYGGTVSIQDPSALNTPISLPITINVRPKSTITLSSGPLNFSVVKPETGTFPGIPTQTFTIQNTGPATSNLDYEVAKLIGLSDWLVSFLPDEGSLGSGGQVTVTVTVAPPDSLGVGTYSETLRVSGYSSNSYQDIEIILVVS